MPVKPVPRLSHERILCSVTRNLAIKTVSPLVMKRQLCISAGHAEKPFYEKIIY